MKTLLLLLLPFTAFAQDISRTWQATAIATRTAQGGAISRNWTDVNGWGAALGLEVLKVKEAGVMPSLQLHAFKSIGSARVQPFFIFGGGAGMLIGGSYAGYAEGGAGVNIGRLSLGGTFRSGSVVGADFEGWYLKAGVSL